MVGASTVRDADTDFPAVGSKLHHRVGLGPIGISDHTEVLEVEPERRLVLDAFIRPIGRARVRLFLEPFEDGTHILMEEEPADTWSRVTMGGPLAEPALRLRNAEALSRLRNLVIEQGPDRNGNVHQGSRRVLVTGGSSGIGLATARALAADGAQVALLARGEEALRDAAASVEGAVGIYAADTTDREGLEGAISEAVRDLGGLDAVVASAASLAFGTFTEMEPEDFDDTIQNVFIGTVNTVRAVLPHLERSAGTLVVLGSVLGNVPQPGLAAYAAAKHAIKGFFESLRAELRDEGSPVSLVRVDPWAIDTPLFGDRLTSSSGLMPPAQLPAYDAPTVADEILRLLENPKHHVTVGRSAKLAEISYVVARPLAEVGLVFVSRWMRAGGDRISTSAGGLRGSTGEAKVSGPLESPLDDKSPSLPGSR